jgi:Mg-chelatase subunit ChlI
MNPAARLINLLPAFLFLSVKHPVTIDYNIKETEVKEMRKIGVLLMVLCLWVLIPGNSQATAAFQGGDDVLLSKMNAETEPLLLVKKGAGKEPAGWKKRQETQEESLEKRGEGKEGSEEKLLEKREKRQQKWSQQEEKWRKRRERTQNRIEKIEKEEMKLKEEKEALRKELETIEATKIED